MEKHACQHSFRVHRHAVGIIPVGRIKSNGTHLVAVCRLQNPSGTNRPVVHPPSISALIQTFNGSRVDRPHPVERSVRILDLLPVETDGRQGALQQRRTYVLTYSGHLPSAQRRCDAQGCEVSRPYTWPRRSGKDRSHSICAAYKAFRHVKLRIRAGTAADIFHRRPTPALLVIQETCPRRHETVVARTFSVRSRLAIRSDGAGDNPGVDLDEILMVDAEATGSAGGEAVDNEIRSAHQGGKGREISLGT